MTTPDTLPIWLDIDPGHDDAMALLLAGRHCTPGVKTTIVGVSTTSGNQTVQKTTQNAHKMLRVLDLAKSVPLVQGCHKPLLGPAVVCEEIHGQTGLDTPDGGSIDNLFNFDTTVNPLENTNAIVYMYESIKKYSSPSRVHLVATAQLTNVALLLSVFPDVKEHIAQIVVMGGAVGVGNMDPAGEFNIVNDPEAARIVFESGCKVVMVPLEVTHTALVTRPFLDRIERELDHSPFATLLVQLMTFFAQSYEKLFHMPDPPLHDPCAVAYVLRPELFQTRLMSVEVETGFGLCRGRTICDVFNMMPNRVKNVHVALKMDVEAFFESLMGAIKEANRHSIINNKQQQEVTK